MFNKAEIDGNGNIVIQNSDNSIITINPDNTQELRQFLIDFQTSIANLPQKIIEMIESKNTNSVDVTKGANVYLGLNFLVNTGYSSGVSGIAFNVSITNLTKENRYFNQPFFKTSKPIEGEVDTFVMLEKMHNINFPYRLEYGQVVNEAYMIKQGTREMFEKVIAQDKDAYLQVVVSTTIGEIYTSNEYKIVTLLDNFNYAK